MIENATLIKGIGGIAAAGAVGGGGYFTYNWLKHEDPLHLLFVTTEAVSENGTEDLYKAKTGETKKEKNYKCVVGTDNYDCDLIKEIKSITNKQVSFNSITSSLNIEQDLDKNNLKAKDKFFLLKTDKKLLDLVLKTPTTVIEVKENKDTDAKIFGKLKFISGKQGNKVLGPVSYFLSKVKSFKDDTTTTFTIADGKQYKCSFDGETTLKDCEIHKFTDTQSSPSADVSHTSLSFNGKSSTEKLTNSTTIKPHEYYLVKFTTPLNDVNTSQNNLIYLETTGETNEASKNVINFSPINPSVIFPQTASSSDANLLIF